MKKAIVLLMLILFLYACSQYKLTYEDKFNKIRIYEKESGDYLVKMIYEQEGKKPLITRYNQKQKYFIIGTVFDFNWQEKIETGFIYAPVTLVLTPSLFKNVTLIDIEILKEDKLIAYSKYNQINAPVQSLMIDLYIPSFEEKGPVSVVEVKEKGPFTYLITAYDKGYNILGKRKILFILNQKEYLDEKELYEELKARSSGDWGASFVRDCECDGELIEGCPDGKCLAWVDSCAGKIGECRCYTPILYDYPYAPYVDNKTMMLKDEKKWREVFCYGSRTYNLSQEEKFSTPENTIITSINALIDGDFNSFIETAYYSPSFQEKVKEYMGLTIDEFKELEKISIVNNHLENEIREITFFNKTPIGNNLYVEYEIKYWVDKNGNMKKPRKDYGYMIKIENQWKIDLEPEYEKKQIFESFSNEQLQQVYEDIGKT